MTTTRRGILGVSLGKEQRHDDIGRRSQWEKREPASLGDSASQRWGSHRLYVEWSWEVSQSDLNQT
jgi:hypothetical protein